MKEYAAKSFDHLSHLPGFCEESIRTHLALYENYVDQANLLAEMMRESLKAGKSGTFEWAEVKRRFAWEFNGMRLHEYYFDNLTTAYKPLSTDSAIYRKIGKDFERYELWEEGFKDTSKVRGVGWTMLVYDVQTDRLFNLWIEEHDRGLLAGTEPLLVMDLFEHAFFHDYRTAREDFIDAFFRGIDWGRVEERLAAATSEHERRFGAIPLTA